MKMDTQDTQDLRFAKQLLENPGLAAKLTNLIGKPLEAGFRRLPGEFERKLGKITSDSLMRATQAALFTMRNVPGTAKSNRLHKAAVATSGAVGGFWGLPALAIELPISTTIMLRSIADVARSEGEPLQEIEAKLACLEVFALGSPSNAEDDAAESGYFAIRTALATSVNRAATHIAEHGLKKEGAPALAKLISKVAGRLSGPLAEKIAAQAAPAIGAAGGALINSVFIGHFQDMAHGHFIVRRLERKYGNDTVKGTYNSIH